MTIKKWIVQKSQTPKGCAEKWPGQWYKYVLLGNDLHRGNAHHSKLALYIGKEQAKAAIDALETQVEFLTDKGV